MAGLTQTGNQTTVSGITTNGQTATVAVTTAKRATRVRATHVRVKIATQNPVLKKTVPTRVAPNVLIPLVQKVVGVVRVAANNPISGTVAATEIRIVTVLVATATEAVIETGEIETGNQSATEIRNAHRAMNLFRLRSGAVTMSCDPAICNPANRAWGQ